MAFQWGRIYPLPTTAGAIAVHAVAHGVSLPDVPVAAACGYKHSLALGANGNVFSWGDNAENQLGRTGNGATPAAVSGLTDRIVTCVGAGALHSACVTDAGEVMEWGLVFEEFLQPLPGEGDAHGRAAGGHALVGLADRFGRNEYLRKLVLRSEAAYLANKDVHEVSVEGVATGSASSSAPGAARPVDDLHVLRLRVTRVRVPVPRLAAGLSGVVIQTIACGYAHNIAVSVDGRMFASGFNDRGQLGLGNRVSSAAYKPITAPAVASARIVKVAAGQQHNVAVDDTGAVYCWGSGVLGQCGCGSSSDQLSPNPVTKLRELSVLIGDVAAGSNHCVAAALSGEVFFWGHSEYNQSGTSRRGGDLHAARLGSRYFYEPRHIDTLAEHRIATVSSGGQFSVAVSHDGEVFAFGWNAYYCLGRGLYDPGIQEVAKVSGLHGRCIRQVACGLNHALAVVDHEGHAYAHSFLALVRAVNQEEAVGGAARLQAPVTLDPVGAVEELSSLDATSGGRSVAVASAATEPTRAAGPTVPPADVTFIGTEALEGTATKHDAVASTAPTSQRALLRSAAAAETSPIGVRVVVRAELEGLAAQMAARRAARGATGGDPVERLRGAARPAPPRMPRNRLRARHAAAAAATAAASHDGTADAATEGEAAAAPPEVREAEVYAHAVIIAHRVPALKRAMAAAAAAPGTAVPASALATGVLVTFNAAERRWIVRSPLHVSVWRALVDYAYGDAMPSIPLHRVRTLAQLAMDLHLDRLVALCSRGRHAPGPDREQAVPSSTFTDDMRSALTSGTYADVRIVTKPAVTSNAVDAEACDKVLLAHRLVLGKSDFFDRFMNVWQASDDTSSDGMPTLTLHEVDMDALRDVIDYLYTGDTKPLRADPSRCMRALPVAAQLCIQEFVSKAEDVIASVMTADDADAVAAFAEEYALSRLLRVAASFRSRRADVTPSPAARPVVC